MDVRKSGEDPAAGSLSGGNLQKFIVGRELDRQPAVLVVNQPTWGVDAGAASRIRQALVDLARKRLGRRSSSARTSTRYSKSQPRLP